MFIPKEIFAHSQIQVIEMTSNGFKPESVSIDQNSSVIFINRDNVGHWPASNVHPTHELFPEFDPRRPIEPGQSWAFRPKKTGEWKFHDHLFPHIKGILIVTKEGKNVATNSADSSLIEKAKGVFGGLFSKIQKIISMYFKQNQVLSAEDFLKLSSQDQIVVLKDMADMKSAIEAWDFLRKNFKGQAGSSGNIHDLAHLVGSLLYENLGFKGLSSCSPDFAYGCYHGFLDRAFEKDLTHLQDAEDACSKLGPENSGPVASCIHGIGHGVASFYSVEDIKGALSSCRKLTSGSEFCFDGVFMEFARSAPGDFYKKEDLLYPCDDLESQFGYAYSFACGRNQTAVLMGRFNLSFDEVVNVCLNSESTPIKQSCFDSLGFSVASTGDVDKIVTLCQKINEPEFAKRCIKAAAGELVFQEIPGWQEKYKAVCNSFEEVSVECLQNVDRIIKEYNRKI